MSKIKDKYFSVNTNLPSPLRPMIRIILCLAFIAVAITREQWLPIMHRAVDVIATLICFQLTIFAILRIYISCAELIYYYEKKSKRNR